MARAERRRAQRSKPAAGHGRAFQQSAYVGTEGLFFQRLRGAGKWIFVVIALLFALGFLGAGVGSDVQGGILDVIGVGGSSASGPSADDAREKLEKNPNDAEALRELATALQTEGKPDEAVAPLERYARLRPKDTDALRELAGLHLAKAGRLRDQVQQAQLEAQALNPGADFALPSSSPLGQALGNPAINQAVSTSANERVTKLYGEMQQAYGAAKTTYQRLVKLEPEDASLQLQLADAAQNSGDTTTAIGAYKRFLVLAPDDPSAPLVKQEIKRLQVASQLGSSAGSSG